MGGILAHLKPVKLQRPNCPLLNTSLSKLREYHASFKSICDNFSIDLTEFEQIFSTNETSFAIWDTDDNGYIDALELFSGLVVFSESKFEDKIKFLFDLFDFNELGKLSLVELQFLLHNCLNSVFKIYSIKREVDSDIIGNFVDSYFAEDTVINVQRLVKWCNNSKEINDFFSTIKKEVPAMKSANALINFTAYTKFGEKAKKQEPKLSNKSKETKSVNEIFNSQRYKTKLEYLTNLMTKNQSSKDETHPVKIKDSVAKMNWVYGFRCNDVRHPLQYIGTEFGKVTSEKLFYISGCVVVIYFPRSNEQTHYLEHEREVISLTVSEAGLVASGELGDKPAIHIWDCTTLQNIAILKGIHNSGVHLLCFLKNNEFIVSCGVRENSPLLIYNIRDGDLVLSTYLHGFALDLRMVKPYFWLNNEHEGKYQENKSNSFLACTDNTMYLFTYETGVFTTGELKVSDFKVHSPITCCLAFSYNFENKDNDKLRVLTGHENGKVILWEGMQQKKEFDDYRNPVVDMVCSESGIAIASSPTTIHFWDIYLQNKIKTVDLTSLKFKLFSFKIGSLTSANKKVYLVTVEGDVVEVSHSTKASRLNNICKLRGEMKSITVVETSDDTLIYVGGRAEAVAAYSSEGRHLAYLAKIEDEVTAIDALNQEDGKKKLVIGTAAAELQIRVEAQAAISGIKPAEPIERYNCNSAVLDVKFSGDGKHIFALCEDGGMFLFTNSQGLYFKESGDNPRKFTLLNEFPISVNFSDDQKTVIVGTSQRTHHLLDFTHSNNKFAKIDQLGDRTDFSILNLRYPSHTKNYLNTMQPASFWNTVKAILTADDSGIIFHWKDAAAIANNCGGYLRGHSSQISRFALTKNSNTFFSLGATDRTLIQWQIENIADENEKKSDAALDLEREAYKVYEEALNREIAYSSFTDNVTDRLRDSFALFRGTTDKTINAMLYDNSPPFEDIPINKRIPPVSLELSFVYGFQSSERRNTLFYTHYHRNKPRRPGKQDTKDLKGGKNVFEEEKEDGFMDKEGGLLHLPPHLQKQMLFSNKTPIPYDIKHEYCERYFVYFVSRIAIIYNPLTNEQRFYEGHRHRITSLCVHPSKMIVATGETSPSPCIHVWSILTLEPYKVLQTFHKDGILHLKFSNDGVFLISISVDTFFSIQIFNWKTEETIVYRNTSTCPIFDVIFNPYNKYEFTTVGHHNIAIWELQGRSLTRKNWIHLKPSAQEDANRPEHTGASFAVLTSAAYLNYHLGKGVDSDIIVGNNYGEIGLITFGKYVCLKKDAHVGMINCLKVTDMISKKLLVLTAGEDECLRIWDTAFNLIHEVNIRRIGVLDVPQSKNISIQSIDVYCCQSPSKNDYYRQKDLKEEATSKPVILLGTRNGDILEAVVNQTFSGLKPVSEKKAIPSSRQRLTLNSLQDYDDDDDDDHDLSGSSSEDESDLMSLKSGLEGTLSLSFAVYLRNHSGKVADSTQNYQQRVLFALHPYSQVMYTAGEDQHIYLWDIEKCKLLMISNQGLTPTAMKLSPNGEVLAVGFENGTLVLLDSKIDVNAPGKHGSPYVLPKFEWIQPAIKEKFQTPVMNIEFSPKGGVMAVSYNNQRPQAQNLGKDELGAAVEESRGKEGAYVAIYMSTGTADLKASKGKNQYTKYTEIRYQQQEGDPNLGGRAVYSMNFSTDENYLLLYYQDVDESLNRVNEDTASHYVVWNLETNQQEKHMEVIKNIRWKKMNFPNNIYGQYVFYNNLLGPEENKKDSLSNIRRPVISSMYDYKPYVIGGSVNGDLHFFKSIALHLEKNYPPENLKIDKMCMSKTYAAHVSFINQVELKGSYLFSTGIHDACIMQWKLIQEKEHWDADYMDLSAEEAELSTLSELPSRDKFENLLNEILPLRQQVEEMKQNADVVSNPEITLELEAIIGRKANDRRNNLFYDFDEKIIYSAGPLIVMYDPNSYEEEEKAESNVSIDDKKQSRTYERRQEFLRVDEETLFPTAPEVSTFSLSFDKRFICVGTQELKARLLIWEVCSRTCIKTLRLNNCSSIQNIRFAFNSRHVCAVGVTPDYTQVVYLIDALKPQVLGCVNFINAFTSKIRDIMFFPNSIYKFVTCGVQHMSVWKYSGSTLSFFACSIEKPRDMLFIKPQFAQQTPTHDQGLTAAQKEELERLKEENQHPILRVTFTCVCFVQSTPVTGDNKGFIYIWQNFKISKRQTAHANSAVLCLNALKNTSIFVSGGTDGRVIVWQLSHNTDNNSYVTEKFYEYSITSETIDKAILNPRNHVQSIFVGSRNILAGTKTGDIYELLKPKDSDLKLKNVSYDSLVVTRLSCNDHQIPKALGFSHRMDKIYAITQKGLFCVWDIKSLDLIYSRIFNRNTTSLIAFKNKPLILITFDNEIIMLNAERGGDFKQIPSFHLKYVTQITDVKVSFNEKCLAVALSSDSDRNAKIELYDLESKEGTFKYLDEIEDLMSSVNFLDFSTDNSYLLYKDNFGVPTVYNIISRTKVNLVHLEFDVEWVSDGIQESHKTKGVQSYYKVNNGVTNRILKMVRIGESSLAVTDEMGTIRIFKYPCETGSSFGYYQCYSEHMNYLNNCILSNDRNYLLTASENDKGIFLWRIKKNVGSKKGSQKLDE